MPNSDYVADCTQPSEKEKINILRVLEDMFDCAPGEQLLNICETQSWHVEKCIDYLINANECKQNERHKNNGAIPKQNTHTNDKSPTKNCFIKRQNQNTTTGSTEVEKRIGKLISDGSKVMVLMRGVPGSGKTSLAKNLVEQNVSLNVEYRLKDFIFSSDDFFYDSCGRYKWQGGLLDQAHRFNQRRVADHAHDGWSPIFVDNTNIKLWEMLYYAEVAIQNGYIIELLEPTTTWCKSADRLAEKNKHGVAAGKIQMMLNNFEKGTVNDLMKMLKSTKYTVTLPQPRSIPPIQYEQQDAETKEVFQIYKPSNQLKGINKDSENHDLSTTENVPKPQRNKSSSKHENMPGDKELKSVTLSSKTTDDLQQLQCNESNVWQPHEKEINSFWKSEVIYSGNGDIQLREHECGEKSILNLLRESVCVQSKSEKSFEKEETVKPFKNLERHNIKCPNENKAFSSLRQIYPNKDLTSLWDLFVKCDGDIDWTVDLLLREEELMSAPSTKNSGIIPGVLDDFHCKCSTRQKVSGKFNGSDIPPTPEVASLGIGIKPQRQRQRALRIKQRINPEVREITESIANCFVLDGEQFSPHVKKLREMREKLWDPPEKCFSNAGAQTDPINDVDPIEECVEADEIIKIKLGENLVKQLKVTFQDEITSMLERLPENPDVNVFMPRSLAKELYMLWVESAYNYLEEHKHKTMREDAHFARLLKNPKYENCSESPRNIEELLDMELAWEICKNEHDNDIQQAVSSQQLHRPIDLATHLTLLKLCENFPNIPRETMIEILSAHRNNYDETIRVLKVMTQPVEDLQQQLLTCTKHNDGIEMVEKEQQSHNKVISSEDRTPRALLQPDDAKRKALHDFEEMRNLAAHHCQLKAECYQKAKEAIQKGNSAVAVYYSQIANLHKMKLDMYNHRAANCIMDVHKYTQNKPELLDLHYLHLMEAIECLDLFLDRHITALRVASRTYKHIFIITGRGLHSTGGVSTIKNKVKCRLKERNLRWSEVNPGLLKIKIFSASKHSKNI